MKNEVFDGFADRLNTKYETNINQEIEELKEKKDKLVNSDNDLEDVEYMKFELKSLMSCGRMILDKLEEDIKIGSKVRNHEVYFMGINSLRDILKELRELNKTVVDVKMKNKMTNVLANNVENNTLNIGSRELLQLIKNAQNTSQLKEITAEFNIVD